MLIWNGYLPLGTPRPVKTLASSSPMSEETQSVVVKVQTTTSLQTKRPQLN